MSDKTSAWIILHCANGKGFKSIFSGWSLVGEHVLANVEEATTSGGAKNIFKGDQAIYAHTHEECL